ncbi:MAG: FecR domain-containing protein [Bacteroidota bacterium]
MEPKQHPDLADETLLARWLSGELTEVERQEVERHPHYKDWVRLVQATDQMKAPAYASEDAWNKLQKARTETKKEGPVLQLRSWMAWAAVIFVAALSLYLLWPSENSVLQTGIGDQIVEQLPDGSTVRLNAESQLSYTIKGTNEKRLLNLKGEAYFEVAAGSEFVVDTELGMVEVLGTAFNVFAREDDFWVNCLEGQVAVRAKVDEQVNISAGESAYLLPNGRLARRSNQALADPVWWTGQTQFKEASLTDVLEEFSRQYPYEIVYDQLPNKKYTGPLPHNDREAAIQLLRSAMGLSFTILDDKTIRVNLGAE